MTWLAIAAVAVVALAGSCILGFVHGCQAVHEAWQRHEIAHGRGWPPLPHPIPPPPPVPPPPKHSGDFRGPS